jgi:3-oxoadipate enol-lactonase
MQRGETVVADGARIAWRLWPGGAARVACIHSLALDGGIWEGVAAALAGRASLLAPDCRGHGASGRMPGPYRTAMMADDLAAVMADLGWPAATIAGCSMGGCIAQDFAARHAARTAGLVLLDTTAWYGADAPAAWRQRAATAQQDGMRALRPFQAARWFSDGFNLAHPEVLDHWLGVFERNDVGCYAATCAMLGATDLRPLLPGIAAPTRVLVGEHDHATPPAMARLLAESIPGATLTVLPGARHITAVECPQAIAASIASVLAG